MSYCECCEFHAPNHSRYLKHLGTKKHAKRYLDAIKNLENPNQNIVFTHVPKEEVQENQNTESLKSGGKVIQNNHLESVQEKQEKKTEKRGRKRVQKKKLEENVQEVDQNNDLEENVQEVDQNNDLEENVQELTDFVFLDTHFLDLYKSLSIPLNPTFLWIIQVFFSINGFFHLFSKKTEEKGISGNE